MIEFQNDDKDFSPLPDGDYQATIYKSEIVRGDKPHLSVEFRVSSGDYESRRLWRRFSFKLNALWALKKLLVSTGNLESSFSGSFDENEIPGMIQGQPVTVAVVKTTYQGKPTNDVTVVEAPREASLPY